ARQVLAYVVGADRQLAVASVDEGREAHGFRPPMVVQGVERSAYRTARVEHVIDEHHGCTVNARRHLGALRRPSRVSREVVTIHGDIELPDRHWTAFDALDCRS